MNFSTLDLNTLNELKPCTHNEEIVSIFKNLIPNSLWRFR